MVIVKANSVGIKQAAVVLKSGGVIVYPTDTAYALGGIFDLPGVTRQILKIKGRSDKKFTLIASSRAQVEKYFTLSSAEKKLVKKYWPGPLSIIVSKRFAVRVPKNKVARQLARAAGRPLIATSANISGKKAVYDNGQVIAEFADKKNQPQLMIDARKLKKNQPSTVVRILLNRMVIVRPGSVKPAIAINQ